MRERDRDRDRDRDRWGWLNPGLRTLDWGFLSEEEEVRAGF